VPVLYAFPKVYDEYNEKYEVRELVIALFLTRETVNKSMLLIVEWLHQDLDKGDIKFMLDEST
jgi:hypothetical protein